MRVQIQLTPTYFSIKLPSNFREKKNIYFIQKRNPTILTIDIVQPRWPHSKFEENHIEPKSQYIYIYIREKAC